MEKQYIFDMSALFRLSEFHLRRFAETYTASAGEYFGMLEKLPDLAPEAKRALERFIARNVDKEDYRSIEDAAALLKELGCEEYVSSLYSILGAYEKGNWRLAAHHAERVKDDFYAFCSRVHAARREAKAEEAPDTGLPLKEYIQRLDEEEENRKLVILAVDDSPVILKSVSAILSDTYKVYTLPKPAEITKVLQKLRPELFLLDYKMPELDGFELVPIIRSFEEHKDTPIIYLTSISTFDNVTAAIALGASDFVVKPFDPNVLKEKIAKHIVRKKKY